MPIFRPDEYKHGNANLAFLDSDFVRGGIRVVATTSNLTDSTMESKVDQLKDGATLVWVSGSSVFYRLKSKANITSLTNGWEEIDLTGTDGADGADGADGNTVLSGAGAPGSGTGNDGDFYIDTSNNDIYGPKTSGSWGSGTSLIGPSGANGTDGADGADGTNATITGASATGLSAGSTPTVTLGGTASARTFAFGIPAGADGADGADGQDGAAATISVGTVTTGSAGSSATVTNSGTSSAATFDFTIPKGDTGQAGADGADGTDGKTILNGASAPQASDGNQGDFWIETSNSRLYGPKGASSWPAGYVDLIGADGADGADGVNGTDGADGANGADGADGKTILNGSGAPSTEGSDGDFWIDTTNNRLYGPKASGSWPATYVDLVGPTTFKQFDGVASALNSRNSYPLADRTEGFLAYMKDTNNLFVYTSSSVANADWQGTTNWKEVPIETSEYTSATIDDLLNSSAGDYLFNLYNTTDNEFNKFDISDFFGYITQQLAQSMVDNGTVTADEVSFGSGNILGDMNGDGSVGTADLLIFLSYFGNTVDSGDFNATSVAEFTSMTGVGFTANNQTKVVPMNASGFSTIANGFGVSLTDNLDYFDFEDGTNPTIGGTWASSANKKLILGGSTNAAGNVAESDPLVFRVSNSAYDQISISVEVTPVNSVTTVSAIPIDLVTFHEIGEPQVNYDIEVDQQDIANVVAPFVDGDTTDIRFQFKATSLTGNTYNISLHSGAVRISNF